MVKTAISIYVLLGLMTGSGAAAATWSAEKAKWVKIKTDGPETYYLDVESVRARGKFRYTWEKSVEDVTDLNRDAVTISRNQYNCATKKSTTLYLKYFLKSGALGGSQAIPEREQVWDVDLPGSVAGAISQRVCARKVGH